MLILNKFLSVVDIAHGGTGNTSGIAVNISAASNSTITTLTLLSLPASQLTGTLPSGSFPALTGDVTTSAGSVATTLATVNGNVGSFGSSTSIPSFTVNAKGLITAASGNAVIAPAGTLTGTTLASNVVSSSLTSLGTQAQALNMGSHLINNLTDPSAAQDAATKSYVDSAVSALNPATACYAASTANIPGTYLNGVAGVGATFTTTATGVFTVDGVTPPINARILIKDQSSGFQNGVYNITTLGSIGVSAIFTRALDYNTAAEMNSAGLIPIINGTLNALSSWQQIATITTVGTDALVFQEFTANPSLYLLKANNLSDVASKSTSFNNLSPMSALGDTIYGGASGTGTALAGNITSTKKFLVQTGNGSVSAAPSWATIVAGDVPTLNQNTTGTASNITASSNSTLTTLTALSLPATQLSGTLQAAQEPAHTGDVTNSAGSLALSLVATTNSTLTTLSALTSAAALATVGTITTGTWSGTTIAVNKGGTGQTSYTDGQLLIGNSSGNTLTKASLTAGANITITPGNGSITIAASSTAIPAYTYVSQSSTLNPAAIGTYYTLSSTSFTVTLPTAAGVAGQSIRFMHNGTNFSQVYTFNTTGGQTILNRGITYTSGQVAAYTTGEFFEYTSDGANWQVSEHQCDTGWISVGSFANFYTYTVTSANATAAATYVPAYVFTVTSANATVGATYTNNGHTYTVAATIAAQTTLVMTGNADPTASGTLTKSGGTGDATITFSAFAGNPNTSTFTVAKTIAAQTTLVTQSDAATPNASGRIVKTGGTGDAVIVYSAVSGSANDIQATTTEPVWFGTPTNNTIMVKRKGNMAQYWMNYYQATAGAVAGSGDFLFPIKMSGQTFDSGVFTYYTGGTAQTQLADKPAEASQVWPGLVTGFGSQNGVNWYVLNSATPYDSTHYRLYCRVAGVTEEIAIGSTNQSAASILNFNFQFELPITGWLP